MAEVLTILGVASSTLSTFLIKQGRLLGGLRQEVQLIGDEFGHMKAFLEKVGDLNQEDDPQLTEWIRQVREVSYDTRDILDEFTILFSSHRVPGFLGFILWTFNSSRNLLARHHLASNLEGIKARVKNISESRLRYESHYTAVLPQAARNTWRHSRDDDALLVEESQLVGIEKPKQLIISKLLEDADSQLKVIAVLGMGGLGKTTLARKVHDDAAVKSHFQIRAWVTVSQNCNFQNLLKGLLQQLVAQFNESIPPQMDSMNVYQLKAHVKDFLGRGRYSVVFDDVWEMEFWESFKFVLPENNYGGNRVMLTTRIADVSSASTTESQDYVHRIECLDSTDSWTLFCKKTFKDKQCPHHLKDVAESIVAKCGGLPLAILAIGGLLASKDTSRIAEWELVQSRLQDEFEGNGKLDRVKKIISLSYNDLPSTLKTCLLYTSIYPEGHKIRSYYLIKLLIAEGFVEQKDGQIIEDTAMDYLKELVNRSLIQLNGIIDDGTFYATEKCVDIHDLLRSFIASKSREQNMVTMISTMEQMRTGCSSGSKVRRLVFGRDISEISSLESQGSVNSCRTIISFGDINTVSKAILAKLLTSKLLTVVHLKCMDLEEIPKEIFILFQLKILTIVGKRIKTVPRSIRKLQKLQLFVLEDTKVEELPREIQKLHKLHYLGISDKDVDPQNRHGFRAPREIGELLELETLYGIDVAQNGIVSEIGKLTKLEALWIKGLERVDGKELCSSLEKLNNLEELIAASSSRKDEVMTLNLNHSISELSLQSLRSLDLSVGLKNMPQWIKNLQRLEKIKLTLSNLEANPLTSLQYLPNLLEIWLTGAYRGRRLRVKAGGFVKLKLLSLHQMEGLRWVAFEEGAMPGLTVLDMAELPLMETLPLGIEHLRQLQELDLFEMNSRLIENVENEGDDEEESRKISHVTQVTIAFRVDGGWKGRRVIKKEE